MKKERQRLYLAISAAGALVMSILNVTISMVFIISFAWYCWSFKGKRQYKLFIVWLILGSLGTLVSIVRIVLYNVS